ncbi:MAG TPA: hypothetical protein VGO93_09145 [Candidatus Xenobia bacterium]|jgi:hypothetical protein
MAGEGYYYYLLKAAGVDSSIVQGQFASNLELIRCLSTGSISIPLLPATGSGNMLCFKNRPTSTGSVTITANGSDTIDGMASFTLARAGDSCTIADVAVGEWEITSQ